MASEWLQSRQLEEFAAQVVEGHKKVVLIAGPSSSGKTTTAKRICGEIYRQTGVDPLYLGTDDYFVERKDSPIGPDGKPDFEGLDCVDLKLFNQQNPPSKPQNNDNQLIELVVNLGDETLMRRIIKLLREEGRRGNYEFSI